MRVTVQINPMLLVWARETAGLSLDEAAEKLGLKDTLKSSGADKLRAIEAGDSPISQARLQNAAAVYRRPLISFYLPAPPIRGDRGQDFRTITGTVSLRDNALLDTLMRDVRARQQMLRELLVDGEEAKPLPFVASATIDDGASRVAAAIRKTLGVTEEHQRSAKDSVGLFALLRAAIERIGVYVLLLGDLGSHHSDIGEDVFRGFALADDIAPFVVINDNDAATARTFTLMHELAHVWIGASGVSGPLAALSANAIERFCNAVAGEFLVPGDAVSALPGLRQAGVEALLRVTQSIADTWNVSQGVVTYRLFSQDQIREDVAGRLFQVFADRWRTEKQRTKEVSEGGPTYFVVRRHRLGVALLGVVRRALQDETITHTRAAKILGVSPPSVEPLLQERIRAA